MQIKKKKKKTFVVINDKGLHTRPATELVRCAQTFESHITLNHRGLTVNAKSLLGILMLAAAQGAEVVVEAEGQDAENAISAIIKLASQKFNIEY